MCGISLLINKNSQAVDGAIIKKMNDKVIHRGPDDEGYYHGGAFSFGHRRLSIIDTSTAGHQPMQKNGDCIVYNGMLYNYIELRDELMQAGFVFDSGTDTEVILASYQHWGVDAFRKFNGMWAFGIYDHSAQTIVLCRDHFGIKPLYYTASANWFAAASEIKQFTVIPGFKAVLNTGVALDFITKGWLNHTNETFFSGVQVLGAGHYLKYNLQTHQSVITRWYSLEESVMTITDDFQKATATVRNLFNSSVQLRMRSDVKLGSCLSGGIDSSSIVCTVRRQETANNYFATFTSCYQDKKYDEQEFSDIVTTATGFRSVKVFPDLEQLFTAGHLDTMLYQQDQPFATASHYSEFNVFKAAGANHMKVMLDGQGADEYLCGYPEFFTAYICELLSDGHLKKAGVAIRLKGENEAGMLPAIKELLKVIMFYPFIKFMKRISGKPLYPWLSNKGRVGLKDRQSSIIAAGIRELSIRQVACSSIPYQLHSEDRNSMFFSIESRLPFLDHRLVEYTIGLPSHFKISNGYSKFVLRKALPELPESVRWRKNKLGFAAPDMEWVLQNHAMIRKELRLAIKETPFFSAALTDRFDQFVNGKLGYEPIYFSAMALNRFCKIFNMQYQ